MQFWWFRNLSLCRMIFKDQIRAKSFVPPPFQSLWVALLGNYIWSWNLYFRFAGAMNTTWSQRQEEAREFLEFSIRHLQVLISKYRPTSTAIDIRWLHSAANDGRPISRMSCYASVSRFMDDPVKKIRLLLKCALRVLSQLLSDLLKRRTHLSKNFPCKWLARPTFVPLASSNIRECLQLRAGQPVFPWQIWAPNILAYETMKTHQEKYASYFDCKEWTTLVTK